MADRTLTERLQPSLLDRLTDLAPSEKSESRDARVIDLRRLREIIQRDLSWLLNTTNNDGLIDATRFPRAAASVLNYGVTDVAGDYSTEDKSRLIRRAIRDAIVRFEPRIHPGSVEVEPRSGDKTREAVINFDIRADMWAQPLPVELYLRSQVDVTTGELSLERAG